MPLAYFGISEVSYRSIQEALRQYLPLERVLIFGSRAQGTYRSGSDIDLAIFGDRVDAALALTLQAHLNDCLQIPYHVDVVAPSCCNNEALKDHINRVGALFFNRNELRKAPQSYRHNGSM